MTTDCFAPEIADLKAKMTSLADRVVTMLAEKNQLYGNSALEPLPWLSKISQREQLWVRCGDKLKRWRNIDLLSDAEDSLLDLIGYLGLILLEESCGPNNVQYAYRRIRSDVPKTERFAALKECLLQEIAEWTPAWVAGVFAPAAWDLSAQGAVLDYLLLHRRGNTMPLLLELLAYYVDTYEEVHHVGA